MKKLLQLVAISLGLSAALGGSYHYWQYHQFHPSTDDAYINAHRAQIAPQVSGRVVKVYVNDNQLVKKGMPLFDIDPQPYALRKDKLDANVKLTIQTLQALGDAVDMARSKVKYAKAVLALDTKNMKRIMALSERQQVSKAQADEAETKVEVDNAKLALAHSELHQYEQQLGEDGDHNAQLKMARSEASLAALDLRHTHVLAPADGTVTQMKLRVGDMVSVGVPMFALIETRYWWLDANFKETQLTRIKPGQLAKIRLDMYPGKLFVGKIQSISPNSGASFSLLPSENASGNWVKVTQRFPVKIYLANNDKQYPLRIGASATVTVDTQ